MKRVVLCRVLVCCLLHRPWRRRVDHGSSALLQKLPATLYPTWKRLDDHLESFWLPSSKVYAFSLNLKINHIILSLVEMCRFKLKTVYTNIIYSINFSQESVKWSGKHKNLKYRAMQAISPYFFLFLHWFCYKCSFWIVNTEKFYVFLLFFMLRLLQ